MFLQCSARFELSLHCSSDVLTSSFAYSQIRVAVKFWSLHLSNFQSYPENFTRHKAPAGTLLETDDISPVSRHIIEI